MSRKLPLWATILTLIGVGVLVFLGFWQLQRLEWKQGVLADVEAVFAVDVMRDDLALDTAVFSSDERFVPGHLTGRYVHDKSIYIQSRVYKKVPGYHVLTPFEIDGETHVLVNRGWVPLEAERGADFILDEPNEVLRIGGLVVQPYLSDYLPENEPERAMWYQINVGQIAESMGIDLAGDKVLYVEVEGEQYAEDGRYPVPVKDSVRSNIRNNHLQYAFFWFFMAVSLIVIYLMRFVFSKSA